MTYLRATLVFLILSSISCICRPSFQSVEVDSQRFLTERAKGMQNYEGILFRTPEYVAFVFEGWLVGIRYRWFPENLSYYVNSVRNDSNLFDALRYCKCEVARVRLRGEFKEHDWRSSEEMFRGNLDIDVVLSYQVLTQHQVHTLLEEKYRKQANTPGSKIISCCDLTENTEFSESELVQIHGRYVRTGLNESSLYDPECKDACSMWVEFSEGLLRETTDNVEQLKKMTRDSAPIFNKDNPGIFTIPLKEADVIFVGTIAPNEVKKPTDDTTSPVQIETLNPKNNYKLVLTVHEIKEIVPVESDKENQAEK